MLFPEDHHPGVDLILPDFTYIADRLDDIEAIVLTHGHEDHIGAVPYLLKLKGDIPLIGSTLTLALVEAKLKEHRIRPYSMAVKEGQRERLGVFDLEFVAVNHSIPDALAVFVRTEAGTLLHTGDFKMDQLPLDGRLTDLRAFARLGEEGVDLFLTDSTNADVPGFTTPELEIAPAIDKVFRHAERRIIVACFSSHVHRVQQVLDAAEKAGRKVAMVGRSMVRNMGIAAELGYLKVPDGILIDIKKIDSLRDDELVLICTGSQGEPMAALSRMANREHRIDVGPGDTVLLASSLIPGNENAVYRIINGLMRLGANVVHKGNAKVHVSGHASAGELLYCYNIVKPRNVLPVHGEWRHMYANAQLAIQSGRATRTTSCSPRTASSSTSSTARPRWPVSSSAATSTSTAAASAAPTRRCSRTAGSCATRASSPASSCSTRPPARSRAVRRSRPVASSRTRRSSSRSSRRSSGPSRRPWPTACATTSSSSRSSAAPSARGSAARSAAGR